MPPDLKEAGWLMRSSETALDYAATRNETSATRTIGHGADGSALAPTSAAVDRDQQPRRLTAHSATVCTIALRSPTTAKS